MKLDPLLPGRPIYPAFLSLILNVSNTNIHLALLIQTVIIVTSQYFFLKEINRSAFKHTLFFFILGLFYFIRNYQFSFMTEDLGLPFVLIAITFLMQGIRTKHFASFLLGFLFLSLSQNTRPSSLLILPMILLWYFIYKNNKKINLPLIALGIMLCLGFVINSVFQSSFSESGTHMFSSFAYGFYGQTKGGAGWTQIYEDFPGVTDSSEILSLSFKNILRNPIGIILGTLKAYRDFFLPSNDWAFVYITNPIKTLGNYISWFVFSTLSVLGLLQLIKNKKKNLHSLMIFLFIGIFLSIPFAVPKDSGHLRTYAAVIPFLLVFPALGFNDLLDRVLKRNLLYGLDKSIKVAVPFEYFSYLLLGVLFIGVPLNILTKTHNLPKIDLQCNGSEIPIVFNLDYGSYFNLSHKDDCSTFPGLCYDKFIQYGMKKNHELFDLLKENTEDGKDYIFTIASDLQTKEDRYILFPSLGNTYLSGIYYGCSNLIDKQEFLYSIENPILLKIK
ncbi:MAG: hypothetical protein GYA51_08935 [Candidatus Methanofastidiosa archaeon]|nr:hypothetical protein [Candidatus Methanofastidiosa archaeon]